MSIFNPLPGEFREVYDRERHNTCSREINEDTGECCDKPATHRMVGETDSFGSEYHFYCAECMEIERKQLEEFQATERCCEWCKKPGLLMPFRDWEEGMHGPVSDVCGPCRERSTNDNLEAAGMTTNGQPFYGSGPASLDPEYEDDDDWDEDDDDVNDRLADQCFPQEELDPATVAVLLQYRADSL